MSTVKISFYFFLIDLQIKLHMAYNILFFHYADKAAKLQDY